MLLQDNVNNPCRYFGDNPDPPQVRKRRRDSQVARPYRGIDTAHPQHIAISGYEQIRFAGNT